MLSWNSLRASTRMTSRKVVRDSLALITVKSMTYLKTFATLIKRLINFLSRIRIPADNSPDVYWEIGDAFRGGRLRYKNWAAVEKKYEKQFKAARELKKRQQKMNKSLD